MESLKLPILPVLPGNNFSLVYKSASEKIIVYSPFMQSPELSNVEVLDLHLDNVRLITCGKLLPEDEQCIVIASSDNLVIGYINLAFTGNSRYDVIKKSQIFRISCLETPSFLMVANVNEKNVLYLGGNCSIHGYDVRGSEVYWNVCPDQVLTMSHVNKSIIVSCEDGSISRIEDEDLFTIAELSLPVKYLAVESENAFTYVTESKFGYFKDGVNVWKVQIVGKVLNIINVGHKYVVIAFENGLVETRSLDKGELLHTSDCKQRLMELVSATYCNQNLLLAIGYDGNVFVLPLYNPEDETTLLQRVQALKDKISSLTKEMDNLKGVDSNDVNTFPDNLDLIVNVRQEQTGLFLDIKLNMPDLGGIHFISLTSDNPSFKQKILNPRFEQIVSMELNVGTDNTALKLQLTAGISSKRNREGILRTKNFEIPLLSFYKLLGHGISVAEPESRYSITGKISAEKVLAWIGKNAFAPDLSAYDPKKSELELRFRGIKDNSICIIRLDNSETQLSLLSDSLSWTFTVVSSLVHEHLGLTESKPSLHYPHLLIKINIIATQILVMQETKQKLNTFIAESISNIKSYLVMAEESLLLNRFDELRTEYLQINDIHQTCSLDYSKKHEQHEKLLEDLKELNDIIAKVSQIRGNSKGEIVQRCRAAIGQGRIKEVAEELFK